MSASDASAVAANSRSRAACPRSPAAVRPETTHGSGPAAACRSVSGCPAGSSAAGAGSAGACSRTTWAFVPLMPNAETPARLGWPVSGQAWLSVVSATVPADQSTCGVGSSTCSVFGTTPWRIASTILMTPATPAAACVWPMLDFRAPRSSGRSWGRSWPYVAIRAWASIGSPREVPVPCASTTSTSAARRPALARAWRITRCCDGPLGAVRPLDAPSWLTAEPRTTASTWCPLRRASESRSTRSTPTPSANPVPSASAANALQRPSWDSPRCRLKETRSLGVGMTATPPATARVHSPCRSACTAWCSATSDDEHAVSTVTAGPSKPNVYDRRPEATLVALPVRRWPSRPSSVVNRSVL